MGGPLEGKRIKHLHSDILSAELKRSKQRLVDLSAQIAKHRSSPSEAGAVAQMNDIAARNREQAAVDAIMSVISERKEEGRWPSKPEVREYVLKDNPTVPPNLQSKVRSNVLSDYPEGEELPIKVFDKGIPRAWQPSDGPIHGSTPSDTISDVRLSRSDNS